MDSTSSNDLAKAPIPSLLFKLALPAITAQVINMLYNIIDRIYIGQIAGIGSLALTGVGICFPILTLVMAFSSLIGMGGAPNAAIKMGQQKYNDAERLLGNCFTMLVILSLCLTALLVLQGDTLLRLFGASDDTIVYASQYMNIYSLGTIFVMLSLGLNTFITTQGFSKYSMYTVLVGAILNIVLDPLFIFVFGMGVRGAALATIISQAVSCIWVLVFLTGKKSILRLRPKYFGIVPSVVAPILALGISPFIMQSTEALLTICFNTSLQKYGGDLTVGAMTVLTSIFQIAFLPLTGLCQGAQPITSYNYGAGKYDRVRQSFRLLFICGTVFMGVYWILNMIFAPYVVRIFTSDAALIKTAAWALRIYMATAFMLGVQITCQQTFIAIGQAKISLFLALLRKIILLIPLIYILPCFFTDKVFAVFLAEPAADLIASITTLVLFLLTFNKAMKKTV